VPGVRVKKIGAGFTFDLRSFCAVIEIEIIRGSGAIRAFDGSGDLGFIASWINGL